MANERTVIIFDNFMENVQLFEVAGDYRHLDGTFIGSGEAEEAEEALDRLLFDDEGDYVFEDVNCENAAEAIRQGAYLIKAGSV